MGVDFEKQQRASLAQVVWSSVLGSTVEWYDFLVYGTASALVFNKLFFAVSYVTSHLGMPRSTILNGVILASVIELATLPAFGWLSDRYGRKPLYLPASSSPSSSPSPCSRSSKPATPSSSGQRWPSP
jgi:MFS family permease